MRILITGASAGLGAEMARQFADRGHDLVLTARRVERLEQLRDEILAKHPSRTIDVAALDVTDDDAVSRVFAEQAPFDRVIVNAGVGSGRPVGTGDQATNRAIAMTNFVAALSQVEAAMAQFRAQGRGHLVVISSFAALRGLRGGPAVYAATKRGVAHLAESLRSEMLGTDIEITTVYPGYIRSEMTADHTRAPFTVDTEPGVRAIVAGVEKQRAAVYAPTLPWAPLSVVMRVLPLSVVSKLTRPPRDD
jgi:short-subunit dehydrogenase